MPSIGDLLPNQAFPPKLIHGQCEFRGPGRGKQSSLQSNLCRKPTLKSVHWSRIYSVWRFDWFGIDPNDNSIENVNFRLMSLVRALCAPASEAEGSAPNLASFPSPGFEFSRRIINRHAVTISHWEAIQFWSVERDALWVSKNQRESDCLPHLDSVHDTKHRRSRTNASCTDLLAESMRLPQWRRSPSEEGLQNSATEASQTFFPENLPYSWPIPVSCSWSALNRRSFSTAFSPERLPTPAGNWGAETRPCTYNVGQAA